MIKKQNVYKEEPILGRMTLDDTIPMTRERVGALPQTRTKAYNLVWIPPRFREISLIEYAPEDQPFRQPIPDKTVENMIGIADQNEGVDVRLWIDSRRMTTRQMTWLGEMTGRARTQNMQVVDLEAIPEYKGDYFYWLSDSSQDWRHDKHSLIWKQVDTARILACLQGDYDQSFYSDADITNLVVASPKVQEPLQTHGLIVCGWPNSGYENGLFGFTRERKDLFRRLYRETLEDVKVYRRNGYGTFMSFINELKAKEKINRHEIIFTPEFDGTEASHPGLDNEFLSTGSWQGKVAGDSIFKDPSVNNLESILYIDSKLI